MVYRRDAEIEPYRDKTRERLLENGYARVARLVDGLEAATGATVAGRRALDYGCGVGRLALPLAERCEHVYGLDVVRAKLAEGRANAQRLEIENIDWLDADRLAELGGRYDLVLSEHVLQHIRAPEGEEIFAQLVRGLRPGGIGWINVTLRPPHPVRSVLRSVWRSPSAPRPRRKSGPAKRPLSWLQIWDPSYLYMMMNSYSLNRLGRLLGDEGIRRWHVRFAPGGGGRAYDAATIVFRKGS